MRIIWMATVALCLALGACGDDDGSSTRPGGDTLSGPSLPTAPKGGLPDELRPPK